MVSSGSRDRSIHPQATSLERFGDPLLAGYGVLPCGKRGTDTGALPSPTSWRHVQNQ